MRPCIKFHKISGQKSFEQQKDRQNLHRRGKRAISTLSYRSYC